MFRNCHDNTNGRRCHDCDYFCRPIGRQWFSRYKRRHEMGNDRCPFLQSFSSRWWVHFNAQDEKVPRSCRFFLPQLVNWHFILARHIDSLARIYANCEFRLDQLAALLWNWIHGSDVTDKQIYCLETLKSLQAAKVIASYDSAAI